MPPSCVSWLFIFFIAREEVIYDTIDDDDVDPIPLPLEMMIKIFLEFTVQEKLVKLPLYKNDLFWKMALKADFPAYVHQHKSFREDYRHIGLSLHLQVPEHSLDDYVRTLADMKPHDSFFNPNDSLELQKFNFVQLLSHYNKYFAIQQVFSETYSYLPKQLTSQSDGHIVINKVEDTFHFFKSLPMNARDESYVQYFIATRKMIPGETGMAHHRRLVGSPLGLANFEDLIPYHLPVSYEHFKKTICVAHWLTRYSVESSITSKLLAINGYSHEYFWQCSLHNDFPFYKTPVHQIINNPYKKAYGIMVGNVFRIRERPDCRGLMDEVRTFEHLDVTDATCIDICDILMELLLSDHDLILTETEGTAWTIPTNIKTETKLESLPTPRDYYLDKQKKKQTGNPAETKRLYYNLKREYECATFPHNQVIVLHFSNNREILASV